MSKKPQQSIDTKKADQQNVLGKLFTKTPETTTQVLDSDDQIEQERRDAYIEPKTRSLLRDLIQCEDKAEIIPKYNPSIGFIYELSERGPEDYIPKSFLENLARLDILHKEFFDSVSVCPNCQSSINTLHNRCPKCKSHNIDKTSLTEHIPCGFIDQRSKYVGNVCPKCGERLVEGQYRNMGRWYVCRDCTERFEDPEYDIVCRSCNKNYTIKEGLLTEISKFSLNQNRKKEIRQNVASLENFRELLTQLGFTVEIPGLATGQKSGMQHHFSLIAKKQIKGQEITIALDHAVSESEVSSSPLILYIYKMSEVKVDIPIFVAMPQLNETAKKIAQGHEILLIEGSTEEKEVIEKIKTDIESRIEMKLIEAEVNQKMKKEKSSFMDRLGKITEIGKKQ
jgi:ssDNA-binding Zn-finger/Zn-ribbon topoisomerase 1